jgi:hypothetical protein
MKKIRLARRGETGREILPVLNVASLIEIEEKYESIGKAVDAMMSKTKWRKHVIAIATILCNEGLKEEGEKPDLTEETVKYMLLPAMLPGVGMACIEAINKGMKMEHETEEKPRDPVLEEIEKKEAPAGEARGS